MSQSAPESAQAPQSDSAIEPAEQKLTLDEMTRVMDVARTLRKERSIAERELNREETIKLLRLKLREAADLAGDPVTDEQIDTAIEHYFANLHEFDPPEPGLETFAAGVYVRRYQIAGWALGIATAALLVWGAWFGGMLPGKRQTELLALQTYSQVEEVTGTIEELAADPELVAQAEAARAEAATYRDRGDVSALEQLKSRLLNQEAVLKSEYQVMIMQEPLSGIERHAPGTGDLSGSYLIVQAVDSSGKVIPMDIRNAENGKMERVTKWAEQVPLEVFEQMMADKQADGVVDNREFAVKQRGQQDVKVTLPGVLQRGRQITAW
ncbi:DUF6384 family protein [Aeoliella sp. ICT_H6.2]|uniref:DUF6384 family protein n=1 Tax=Aeoliella straminimaris TaxID=2954799 RepID=A0A9X2JJ46_9BACT|nr:DUF6384 family protein [Aeoliella straminimaris]MCO6047486.1 DUF6384 family protein [Aeoliella straminimaris]